MRLASLDAFRGLTVAAMIVVNCPGNETSYSPLRHAAWIGWTPTDLIFPFFLFIMGAAVPFSAAHRLDGGDAPRQILRHALWRSLILIAIGLPGGISIEPDGYFQIPGVLQRIGICYFASVLLFLRTGVRGQLAATGLVWILYWLLLRIFSAPGYPAGDLTPEGNIASFIDRRLMGPHLYTPVYDPEGLLSTLGAFGSSWAGLVAGEWLRASLTPRRKAAGMFAAGLLAALGGRLWELWLPFIKNLWTSSFALFSSGLALCLLSVFYWLIDVKGHRRWARFFEVFGVNAIAAYCLASLGYALMLMDDLPSYFSLRFFGGVGPESASLAFALSYMLCWWLVLWILDRNRLRIKI